jgi:DNA processing protein
MSSSNKRKWLALSLWHGFGAKSWQKLLHLTENPLEIFENKELLKLFTGGRRSATEFNRLLDKADEEEARSRVEGFHIMALCDPDYPPLLRSIPDPPPVLYCIGDRTLLPSVSVSIVGTRYPTSYGIEITRKFAAELARSGLTIVSGLAVGIDAQAHESTLNTSGKTIAVLGCGLNQNYPASNHALRARIESDGLVVSEYPWGTSPSPGQFPQRNRIISGLSLGTLIIEAREGSGALITGNLALEQGREVMAVPGKITSTASKGPLMLIQQGATPILSVEDVLNQLPQFNMDGSTGRHRDLQPEYPPESLTSEEKTLWRALSVSPVLLDNLIAGSGLPAPSVHSILLKFELTGWVEQLPGKHYKLTLKNR